MSIPEKNPNGGYLRPNQYGLFGVVDVTPQLLAEIQKTGKMTVSVGEVRNVQHNGDSWQSARISLKPYQPKPDGYNQQPAQYQQQGGYQQQQSYGAVQNGYAPAPGAGQYQQAPAAHHGAAQQPAPNNSLRPDEIPF